ncbi:MAG: multicopper oxidase family protein, partial [Planktomarina sp.]
NYSFQTPDAGTYWYHSHYLSYEQVERGLYGALIVDDPTPPDVDHDIVAVIDDWLINEAGELDENFGNRHELSHAGRVGNFARAVLSQDTVRLGDRIRLRMINAATARVFALNLAGLNGQVVALDGMNLSQPLPMDTLTLAPAQRIDLIADVVAAPDISFRTRRGNYLLGSLALDGENANRGTGPIPALAQTNVVAPDLSNSIELTLNMQGGAMARGHGGDDLWAFNDVSGLPNVPFGTFQRGQTAVINLVNRTSFPHGMHLHGHHFSELTPDGQLGPYRDTTLVEAGESRKIACVFDNPGRWLFHCHMLGHQAAGMKTWVTVA